NDYQGGVMSVEIKELSACDEEIVSFLNSLGRVTPSVLGYHYPFYRDMLVEIGIGQPIYLGARLNDTLIGLLPAFKMDSTAGVVYASLPFFGPNAGVLSNADERRGEIHRALLQTILARARQDRALSCSIYTPFLFDEFDLYDSVMPDVTVV